MVFQSQGVLECPSHTDLSALGADNSEDASTQASAHHHVPSLGPQLHPHSPCAFCCQGCLIKASAALLLLPVVTFPEPHTATAPVPVWGMSPCDANHRYFYLDKKCFN